MKTALVLVLPEAFASLEPVRALFDSVAVVCGIPLHVTVLSPFVAREELSEAVLDRVRQLFAGLPPMEFELARVDTFPGVVYAAPEPDDELRRCIAATCRAFPETPPYGGAFTEIVPHATLALVPPGGDQADLSRRIRAHVEPLLPIRCRAETVSLLVEHEPNRWRERERLPLVKR